MPRTFLTAYPWDLIDEGVDAALDRLHGELGVSGVSVWAATPPRELLRPRAVAPRVFRTRGGLFYQPSPELFAATRCKPVVSSWLQGRNPLARIAEGCARRGLALRARVSAAATGRLANRYPAMACRNVFDVESTERLCLADPDVQAYLCSLAADLTGNYGIEGLVLADFGLGWSEAFATRLDAGRDLGEAERCLLGLCFRECCHQKATAAGLDVEVARRVALAALNESLISGAALQGGFADLVAAEPALAAYLRWQTDELNGLLRRVAESCRCELLLEWETGIAAGFQRRSLDCASIAGVLVRADDPAGVELAVRAGAPRVESLLGVSQVAGAEPNELVSVLSGFARRGTPAVEIENYGLLSESALTAVKQAIRYARRSHAG